MKTKKNLFKILVASVMVVVLMMSSTGVSVLAKKKAKDKGYQFTYNKVTIYMGGPAKDFIKKAGKPVSYKESKSCAYKGKDRTYQYDDFILYTYSNSDKGAEYVCGITFLTNKVQTKEGIKIGTDQKNITKKYGKAKAKYGIYTYKKGNSKIQIEVTNKKVSNIRYVLAK